MEYFGIIGAWQWAGLLFAAGSFLFGLACVIYVAMRFLIIAISLDAAILREFKGQSAAVGRALGDIPEKEEKLKSFIQSRMTPTEGEFVPQSEEEQFIQEQVEHLRRQGMTDEELDAFVRQAAGDMGSGLGPKDS